MTRLASRLLFRTAATRVRARGVRDATPKQPKTPVTKRTMSVKHLGRVQLRIMQVLWERGRATAREITRELNQSERIAHSTVQTLLRGLEEKGAAAHDVHGRTFTFYALVQEEEFKQSAANDLLQRVFAGSALGLVSQLLAGENVSDQELAELRKLINRQSRKQR